MKPTLKLTLLGLALLAVAAVGNQYYETLPGLVIRHPSTGAVTAHINGTNGMVTAGGLETTGTFSAPSAQIQASLGQVYQGTNANLTAQAAGNGTGLTSLSESAVTNAAGVNLKTALSEKQAASAVLDHYAGTDTNALLAAIGGITGAQVPANQTNATLASLGGVAKAGDTMTGALRFSGTTQPGLQLNQLTTTQRDALTGTSTNEGTTLWNTTQKRLNVHNGTAWTDGFVRLAGDTMTGTLAINNGSLSASVPMLDLAQTWNNAGVVFTGLRLNITNTASATVSLVADFEVGGVSKFYILRDGSFAALGTEQLVGNLRMSTASPTFSMGATDDVVITRDGAATWQLGIDAASPIAQTLKAHDGSGTDKNGASLTLEGGQSTGTGRGGDLVFRTSITTNSASAANFYSTRSYHGAKFVDLTDATTNLLFKCSLAPSTYCGGAAIITLFISNGTDFKVHTSNVSWSAVNKGGTITGQVVEAAQLENHIETAGTAIADTYTLVQDGANNTYYISVTPTQGTVITPSVYRAKWVITALNSNDPATITPP